MGEHRRVDENDCPCFWCDVRACLEVALGVLILTLFVIFVIYA